MISMLNLQLAVLEDDNAEVRDILDALDRKTESEMFIKAANHFGFTTIEHHGRQLAMRRHISQTMGYNGESGLRMLCERHDLDAVSLGAFAQNVRDLAIQEFGLKRNDGKTVFVGWDAFLLAGMHGTTPQAKQVQIYLLNMERSARVAAGALDLAKGRQNKIAEADRVVSMVARAERLQNDHLRAEMFQYLDQVLDGALHIPEQCKLFE